MPDDPPAFDLTLLFPDSGAAKLPDKCDYCRKYAPVLRKVGRLEICEACAKKMGIAGL